MIFLTVGHQTPFDRLVKAMDLWAASNPEEVIRGQIGEGNYLPKNFSFQRWLTADQFTEALDTADFIVSHAGTGTIMEASERRKRILVMPRVAALGETRNDHQIGTARYFSEAGLVKAVNSEAELCSGLAELRQWQPHTGISTNASDSLISRISKFIDQVESNK